MELKSREQKARRELDKIGCRLIKSRKQSGYEEGMYMIVNFESNVIVSHWGINGWIDLDDVEDWIKENYSKGGKKCKR